MKSKLDKPITITIPADKVDAAIRALSSAWDNAEHFGLEIIEDDPEIRALWHADCEILGELHGMVIAAARQCDGCGCRNVTVTVESTTAGDETARNYCAHCAGGAA